MRWPRNMTWGFHSLFLHSCALVVIWRAYSSQHHPVLTPEPKNQCEEESYAYFELHCKGRSPEAAELAYPLSVSGHSEGLWLGMLSWEAWIHGFPLNSGFQEKWNIWERNCLAGTCLVFWDGKKVREDRVMQVHCACWGYSGKTRRRRKRAPSMAPSFSKHQSGRM